MKRVVSRKPQIHCLELLNTVATSLFRFCRRVHRSGFSWACRSGAVLVLWFGFASFSQAGNWPLTGATGAHDPTIIKEGARWWCFTTGQGLPVKSSPDGLAWTQGVRLFDTELPWWRTYAPNMGTLDVWAPDLHFFANRYWCFYCVSEFGKNNSAIGLKSCSSILAGDWRDEGLIISSKAGVDAYNAIDPSLTVDSTGAPWLTFGSYFDGIHLVQLDPATMKPMGTNYNIARRINGVEAPNIVYNNGFYYLFVSIDTCCQGVNSTYKIAYGRSTSITGPYVDKNNLPMMSGATSLLDTGDSRYKGPGGEYVYHNGNAWVIARHAYDALNNGAPTLLISDLYFDSDNWPTYTAPALAAPMITTDPLSQTLSPGSNVSFTVAASGSGLSYAWQKNGTTIAGATSATLSLANIQANDNGSYTAVVSNSSGQATSSAAVLLVDTPRLGRIINLSVRSQAGTGSQTLIAGFIIAGSGTKPILVRGTGPTLTNFGVTGVLADPLLDLFSGPTLIAENDSWALAPNLAAIQAVNGHFLGTFVLNPKDAVLLSPLAANSTGYTAQVKGADGGTGVALVEVFDTDTADPGTPEFGAQPRLTNISARSQVGTGGAVLIAGFIINGNVPKRIMLRASGPTLANFGLSGLLADPILELHDVSGRIVAQNDSWSASPNIPQIVAVAGDKLGSYTLDAKDAVLIVTLPPGSYTAIGRGVNDGTGVALIEVFDLD